MDYAGSQNRTIMPCVMVSHPLVVNSLILAVNVDGFAPDEVHIVGTVVYYISMKVGSDM